MFALPEIVDLLRRNTSISETGTLGHGGQGLKDAIRQWIVIRSVIGCIVGALPGLGGPGCLDHVSIGIQSTTEPPRPGKAISGECWRQNRRTMRKKAAR